MTHQHRPQSQNQRHRDREEPIWLGMISVDRDPIGFEEWRRANPAEAAINLEVADVAVKVQGLVKKPSNPVLSPVGTPEEIPPWVPMDVDGKPTITDFESLKRRYKESSKSHHQPSEGTEEYSPCFTPVRGSRVRGHLRDGTYVFEHYRQAHHRRR